MYNQLDLPTFVIFLYSMVYQNTVLPYNLLKKYFEQIEDRLRHFNLLAAFDCVSKISIYGVLCYSGEQIFQRPHLIFASVKLLP